MGNDGTSTASAGLVLPEENVDRAKYMRAVDSAYWEMCRALAAEAQEHLDRAVGAGR